MIARQDHQTLCRHCIAITHWQMSFQHLYFCCNFSGYITFCTQEASGPDSTNNNNGMSSGNHHSTNSNDNNNESNSDSDIVSEVDKEWELKNWNGQDRNNSNSKSDGGCANCYVKKGLMEKSGL